MDKVEKEKIKKLIHSIGLKYGLTDDIIKKIVDTPYRFTKEKINAMVIPEKLSKEEFNDMDRSFRYLSFGTLFLDYNLYKEHWKKKDLMNNINNNKWKK